MKLSLLALAAALLTSTAAAQTGWQSSYTSSPSYLYDVFFVDTLHGWIVGGNGYVAHTTDLGLSYSPQVSGVKHVLRAVHFTDPSTGWVVGDTVILHTTDGGTGWSPQVPGVNQIFAGVFFVDPNKGWAVGGGGTVLHTTNGGTNWTTQTSNTNVFLYSVFFADTDKGWATGSNGTILRTTDGGTNWTVTTRPQSGQFNSVYFIDENHGWIAGLSRILHTTDGGTSWDEQLLPTNPRAPDPSLYCVYFPDPNNGWISGGAGGVLSTSDGGATWRLRDLVGASFNYSIHMFNDKIGWMVGGYYTYFTRSGGTPVAIDDPGSTAIPAGYTLEQNFPNPFNPATMIKFSLPSASEVRLDVLDVLGREVSVLVNEKRDAGVHEVRFQPVGLSSGMYYYKIQAREFVETRPMLLLR